MTLTELLSSAVGTGEIIRVLYNGGSRAGQPREVTPISVSAGELVVIEPDSPTQKRYKLDKIAWAELSDGSRAENSPELVAASVVVPALTSVKEYAEHFEQELRGAGWNIETTSSGIALSIQTYFKNGKPKRPQVHVCVSYTAPCGQAFVDVFSDAPELQVEFLPLTGCERPWRVESRMRSQGRSFKDIHSAMVAFIEDARSCK